MFRIEPATITLPGTEFGPIRLNRAIIQKGLDRQLVYYWFEGRGRSVANDIATKLYTVADSLTRGRRDIAVVRLITRIDDAEPADAADVRLQQFLRRISICCRASSRNEPRPPLTGGPSMPDTAPDTAVSGTTMPDTGTPGAAASVAPGTGTRTRSRCGARCAGRLDAGDQLQHPRDDAGLPALPARQTDTPHEVIVVDNASDGSADGDRRGVSRNRPDRPARQSGLCRRQQLAATRARGTYILLLNPDTLVLDHAVDRLVAFAARRPQAGIWGGRTVFGDRASTRPPAGSA